MKQWEMQKHYKDDPRVRFFIGDVRDKDRIYRALHKIDFVVHAAAPFVDGSLDAITQDRQFTVHRATSNSLKSSISELCNICCRDVSQNFRN
jgi:dTDP-D-glucose 4,6-dehydratase